MLMEEESIALLAASGSEQECCKVSVRWQRELLEHCGVEMDHGCQALGQTPQRFPGDQEVYQSFVEFQQACGKSAQLAKEKWEAAKTAGLAMPVS